MGAMERRKGVRGESEACDALRRLFPNVRRKAMQSRGGHEGADLENTPGLHVEVGIGRVNPRAKWEQANLDSLDHPNPRTHGFDIPIALTKKDSGPLAQRTWLVTISAEAFMDLVELARKGAGR